jgi:hypothetical protein
VTPCTFCDDPRDLSIASNGHAFVFNNKPEPSYVSEFDPVSGTWTHQTFTGLSVENNLAYGGLAINEQSVFATSHGGSDRGIVRFDRSGGPTTRFASNIEPLDVSVGLDGLLYALHPTGSPGGQTVNVYDPTSLAFIRSIDVGDIFNRGVAADFDGSLFVISTGSGITHFRSNGIGIKRLPLDESNRFDIDISSAGKIAVGGRFGIVSITDRSLASVTSFKINGSQSEGSVFVAFVPLPEPHASSLLFIAAFLWPRRPNRT